MRSRMNFEGKGKSGIQFGGPLIENLLEKLGKIRNTLNNNKATIPVGPIKYWYVNLFLMQYSSFFYSLYGCS